MSDSSEDEDLSRFKDVVDNSFVNLNGKSLKPGKNKTPDIKKLKSERYLETSAHYNDVVVPEEMKRQIGAKLSALIQKNIEFVDVEPKKNKKRKIKGGVKLFKNSEGYLSCEGAKDTYTAVHNSESKKIKISRRQIDENDTIWTEDEKINLAAVSGDHILSKEDTKHWKSRRKEKVFKYKKSKGNIVIAVE